MTDTKVRLIGITVPKIEGLKTAEDLVVYAARVSNPDNQMNMMTGPKLLRYLVKNNHWSPLEMAHAVLEIETTRDIAHQIVRHRSFAFQEFSQRYADPTKDMGFVIREARFQDTKNRQNSIDLDMEEDSNRRIAYQWEQMQRKVIEITTEVYEWATAKNIAKEQRRAVLPEGLTKSRLYMSGSFRSWLHYIMLRSDPSTQKEHREVAELALVALSTEAPSLMTLLDETA